MNASLPIEDTAADSRRIARAIGLLCVIAAILIGTQASAQSYPAKTVRIVVGFTPGGSVDFVARLIARELGKSLGQQFVVENRDGATGNIAAAHVAKTTPDGHTLLIGTTTTFASGISTFKQLQFDPRRDFAPIALLVTQNNVVLVHPSVPAKSVKDLIALAKARPGALNFGTSGMGGMHHLRGEMFMMHTGTRLQAVHYRGASQAVNSLLSGEIEVMFDTAPTALLHHKNGKVRILAVMSMQRLEMLPNIPTLHESGLSNFENRGWQGMVAPAGIPAQIVRKLNEEVNRALTSAEIQERLSRAGLIPGGGSEEDFASYIRQETEKYAKIVKAAGMVPQ